MINAVNHKYGIKLKAAAIKIDPVNRILHGWHHQGFVFHRDFVSKFLFILNKSNIEIQFHNFSLSPKAAGKLVDFGSNVFTDDEVEVNSFINVDSAVLY